MGSTSTPATNSIDEDVENVPGVKQEFYDTSNGVGKADKTLDAKSKPPKAGTKAVLELQLFELQLQLKQINKETPTQSSFDGASNAEVRELL
jgi:hypothetical protein